MGRTSRAASALIVATSALVWAALGLFWTHLTGLWQGGGTSCEGPISLPGHRAVLGCIHYPPQWGWLSLGIIAGAVLGAMTALFALKLYRYLYRSARRSSELHP